MNRLHKFTNPTSVAIIGASSDPSKIGYQILNNLISGKFKGKVYPINPKAGKILGLYAYADVKAVPEQIDLAVIAIPAKFVLPVLKECAQCDIKSVIVISAGFVETGAEGEKLQEEIVEICRKANITMLGPNCLGMINAETNLNVSFAQSMPRSGNISLISQSGAMITALIDWSASAAQGFNKIFSMGNKADIKDETVFEYLYEDDKTDVIIAYMEGITVNRKLTELLAKNARKKPTVVLFGGKSGSGAKAASSHTGSMISSYLAVETYLKQAGAIVANSLSDLFLYCQIFSNYRKINGDKIAIITNAGGPAIVTCDELFASNLKLADLTESTHSSLKKTCRVCANINNPIDILGDSTEDDYKRALEIIDKDINVDGIIILLTPQSSTNVPATAKVIADFKSKKPVVSAFIGGKNLDEARNIIEKSGKPCFVGPEEAVSSIRALVTFNQTIPEIHIPSASNSNFEMRRKNPLLKKFNLPVLEYFKADGLPELRKEAGRIGYPVVLKTAKPEIIHKSDSGAVILDIKNDEELKKAFSKLGSPVIIGKMIKGEHELFLGIKKDPNVGTLVAFGTGGIYSEVYKDISYRVAPITPAMAKEMIFETKMGRILNGARGQEKYDLEKLSDIIISTAKFADYFENISEIDFNPLIAQYPNFHIVDVRIIER